MKEITKEGISRADFFGVSLRKGLYLTKEWAANVLKPISFLTEDENETVTWEEITEFRTLRDKPRLLYRLGRPIIIVREGSNGLAFEAVCPKDQFLLQHTPSNDRYFCAQCQISYQAQQLKPISSKTEQGRLYLKI